MRGEIVIEELKIYQFVIKKLFRKFDDPEEQLTLSVTKSTQ
jgi:hypothetical protein